MVGSVAMVLTGVCWVRWDFAVFTCQSDLYFWLTQLKKTCKRKIVQLLCTLAYKLLFKSCCCLFLKKLILLFSKDAKQLIWN